MSSAVQSCPLCSPACKAEKGREDCFARLAKLAISGNKRADSVQQKQSLAQLEQLQKDQRAKRRAEAASAVYEIDVDGKMKKDKSPSCLTMVDTSTPQALENLEKQLGLPAGTLDASDFSNERNGYRAGVFFDQREAQYVVAFRGTNKNNLIDWKNNVNNQLPNAKESDAPSYFAAKNLGLLMSEAKPPVEYTGHSKGGGEVYEALSGSPDSKAVVFNAAGPSPRVDSPTRTNIANRTQNYQTGGDMLNLMQDETDPERTIANMRWLRGKVADGLEAAVKITDKDNISKREREQLEDKTGLFNITFDQKVAAKQLEANKKAFDKERDAFIAQLDAQIAEKEQWLRDRNAGKPVGSWKPPFSESLGERRVVGGDPNRRSVDEGMMGLGSLIDHKMETLVDGLEKQMRKDQKAVEEAAKRSDPNFSEKLDQCNSASGRG